MINRELKQSTLYNYINGNYTDLTEVQKILSAIYTKTLNINIIDDIEE